jgi:integrase
LALADLRRKADASSGKSSAHDYITCIERYFVPYFGERLLEELTITDIREFELWRDRQMRRKPATSTLNNFTSAWNKLIATAVEHGFISERLPVPKLTAKGEKGKTRPAFTKEEIDQLLAYMQQCRVYGGLAVERETRPLLCDYVVARHEVAHKGCCSLLASVGRRENGWALVDCPTRCGGHAQTATCATEGHCCSVV